MELPSFCFRFLRHRPFLYWPAIVIGGFLVGVPTLTVAASDSLSLAGKAHLLEVDLAERFLESGQVRVRRRLPSVEHPFMTFNMSDTAYMTGIYSAMQTWRFLATGEAQASERATEAASALVHLVEVTGQPGLLARASIPADARWFDDGVWRETSDTRYRWRGNVSSDQVDAFVFGLYVYGEHLADSEERLRIGRAVGAVADAIIRNGHMIVGFDGQPTTWGHYERDYVVNREPMNALLLLQMLKVAHALTDLPRYDEEYRRLIDQGYARIGEQAREDEPPLEVNHSDDVLIALALYPLLELEQDVEIRAHYLEAARRWFHGDTHPGIDVEANPFATFLYRHWTGESDAFGDAVGTLRNFPLDMKWNHSTIDAYVERFDFEFESEPSVFVAEGSVRPISQRGRTWSFLVHNPYRVGGNRHENSPFETNGLDYLVSYWFGRAHGFITAER